MCFLFTTVEFSSMSSDGYSNPKTQNPRRGEPKPFFTWTQEMALESTFATWTYQRDVFRSPNSLKTRAKLDIFGTQPETGKWKPNLTQTRLLLADVRTHHYPWVELLDDNDVAIKVSTWIIIACVLILCCYLLPFRCQSPKYENGI